MARAGQVGISGLAVALAAAGGVLVYAALRGVTPLEAFRGVLSGDVAPVPNEQAVKVEHAVSPGGQPYTVAPGASGPNAWLAETALTQRGVPYKWGGASPSGFDCSGLVYWSFAQHGIKCPRTTYGLITWSKLKKVDKSVAASGDLAWWTGHVVILINNTECVAAQHTGTVVQILPVAKAHAGTPTYLRYTG